MELFYANKKIKKICTEEKAAKKILEERYARKLHKAINFLEAAPHLHDISHFEPYGFHSLIGKRKGEFSIAFAGKNSSWRLILLPCDGNGDEIPNYRIDVMAQLTFALRIKEVSKHYE